MTHEWRSSIVNKVPPRTLIIAIAACMLGVVLALVEAELPADTAFFAALPLWLVITCTTAFLLTTVGSAIGHLVENLALPPLSAAGLIGTATIVLVTIPVALMCLPIDSLLPEKDSLFETSSASAHLTALLWGWVDQFLNLLPAIAGFWLFIRSLDVALPAPDKAAPKLSDNPSKRGAEPGRHLPAGEASRDGRSPHDREPSLDRKSSHDRKPSALERRFPEIAGQTLLAIEADEHYVRLHTDRGSKHVLYRFRDALRDVEDLAGLRIHRSWWVAADAVKDLERTATGFSLKLEGGLTAPVSQTYRREVEKTIQTRSKSP